MRARASPLTDLLPAEEQDDDSRAVAINLLKVRPTSGKNHWVCVLKGDKTIDTARFRPDVIVAEGGDTTKIREAIERNGL